MNKNQVRLLAGLLLLRPGAGRNAGRQRGPG